MSTMMLTALDAAHDRIINVVSLDQRTRDQIHGRRSATQNGYDMVCRQCGHPVHLAINHHARAFWRHNPGAGERCILDSIKRGESQHHIAAKYAIAKTIDRLSGWEAIPEQRFESGGELVIVDVYAKHSTPAAHQVPTAWEVQLSRQTHGELQVRTEERTRLAGCRTAWVTPHREALADSVGVITDAVGANVVDRLYTSPYDQIRLPPMPLGKFVNLVARRRDHFLWSQSGENGEYIAYPSDSVNNLGTIPKTRRRNTGGYIDDAADRDCDRPVRPAVIATADLPRKPARSQLDQPMTVADFGYRCSRCGLSDFGWDRQRRLGFNPKPCQLCRHHFTPEDC